MQPLSDLLTGLLSDAFARCGFEPKYGQVVPSQRPDLCQFQCNGALAAARTVQQNPREVAQAVAAAIAERDVYFSNVEIAGPGYINLNVADEFLAKYAAAIAADARLLCPPSATPARVVIDFGGLNIAKSMHVGHLRSSAIGDSLQRVFRFVGDSVISDIHLGDWGTPMGMLIYELQRRSPTSVYFDAAYAGPYPDTSPVDMADLEMIYPEAAARCAANPQEMQAALEATAELQAGRPGYRALWQHFLDVSVGSMQELLGRLGVHFDLWYGESDVHERIPALLQRLRALALQVLPGQEVDHQPLAAVLDLPHRPHPAAHGQVDVADEEGQVAVLLDRGRAQHLLVAQLQPQLLRESSRHHHQRQAVAAPRGKGLADRARVRGVVLQAQLALGVQRVQQRVLRAALAAHQRNDALLQVAAHLGREREQRVQVGRRGGGEQVVAEDLRPRRRRTLDRGAAGQQQRQQAQDPAVQGSSHAGMLSR